MSAKNPIVSVIIPCFNHGIYLDDCIESVETCLDKELFEIIIIDDGSNEPETLEKLSSLEGTYKIIRQQNRGLSAARNTGIQAGSGEYILLLDSDNKIRSSYITKGIQILNQNSAVGIVYGDAQYFGEENRLVRQGEFNKEELLIRNYIDACVLMRKEIWKQVGGYDVNLNALEDWDMHLSAMEAGWTFYYIPEILFDYRLRKDSMARTYTNEKECIEYIAKKHGNLYRSAFLELVPVRKRLKRMIPDIWRKLTGH